MKVSHQSTETILIPLAETVQGVLIDPTGYPVEIALIADTADPTETDWLTATWETNVLSDEHNATIIVGPGGSKTLTRNAAYRPWVRVTAPGERPVLKCPGMIRATL